MGSILASAAWFLAWMVGCPAVTDGTQEPPPVLRVSLTTVVVDAIVTDRHGEQVADLRAEDFEVFQDGRPQTVATFGYVSASSSADPVAPDASQTTAGSQVAVPPQATRTPSMPAAPNGRLLVIVVDDLTLSPESMLRTKQALTRIVDAQIEPADRVALVRTSGGAGSSQPFTSDKAVLRELVDRLRFNSRQFERDDYKGEGEKQRNRGWPPLPNPHERIPPPPVDTTAAGSLVNEDNRHGDRALGAGVIGTLQSVVAGLGRFPGRKGILLFSDGFTLSGPTGGGVPRMMEQALHRLVDRATRSHTVIYSINVRPWEWMNEAAEYFDGDPSRAVTDGAQQADRLTGLRADQFSQLTEGPAYLATQTGGLFFRNPSDLPLVARRSLDDQRGYYLLGYTPDAKTLEQDRQGRAFHTLRVRVRGRSGLRVRSRRGFLGGSDPAARPDGSALTAAAVSPFAVSTLDLKLTGFFAGRDGDQSIVRALVYVDAASLEFQRDRNGKAAGSYLELVALLVDERGVIAKRDQQAYRIGSREDVHAPGGLVYRLDIPVKAPGPYIIRVAAREVASNKTGSASQFVMVPDLGRKRLSLSGVVLSASEGHADLTSGTADSAHPAVRRFRMPAQLGYAFQIYNARYEARSRKPSLRAQVRLLRDGRVVYTAPVTDVATAAPEGTPVSAIGSVSLGEQTSPGEYTLAVTVIDSLGDREHGAATSVIDFTVQPPADTYRER